MPRRITLSSLFIFHSFSGILLLFILILTLTAPLLTPHHPRQTDLAHSLAAPSADHWLGTDLLGRDVFTRALYGGRQTLLMATGATLIAVIGGLLLGTLAVFYPIFISLLDALLAVPGLLIALVVMALVGKGVSAIMLAVGIAQIGPFARTTRDALLTIRHAPFIEAAISVGVPTSRLITHHLWWNIQPILLTFTGIIFSWSLLNSAALAFLGFTGDASTPDWGIMLAAGRQTFAVAPWEALSAGILLTLTVGAVNRLANQAR